MVDSCIMVMWQKIFTIGVSASSYIIDIMTSLCCGLSLNLVEYHGNMQNSHQKHMKSFLFQSIRGFTGLYMAIDWTIWSFCIKMNERYFKFARKAAMRADYHGSHNFAPAIGGVAVYKGSIVAEAWNSNKTSPLQMRYNVYRFAPENYPAKTHCETALIQKLRWKFGNSIQWDKIEIYLYREYKDGTPADARCCPSCLQLLTDLGIKKIYYSSAEGYRKEKLR